VPTYFRIVKSDPPTTAHFLSNRQKGRAPRRSERDDPWEHDAISVFTRRSDARAVAKAFPMLGSYLARLSIPDDQVSDRRTRRRTPFKVDGPTEPDSSHYNLRGPAELLATYVEAVEPIGRK
jgi:hypothetical protein